MQASEKVSVFVRMRVKNVKQYVKEKKSARYKVYERVFEKKIECVWDMVCVCVWKREVRRDHKNLLIKSSNRTWHFESYDIKQTFAKVRNHQKDGKLRLKYSRYLLHTPRFI